MKGGEKRINEVKTQEIEVAVIENREKRRRGDWKRGEPTCRAKFK